MNCIQYNSRAHCSISTARKLTQRINGNYWNNNMTHVNWFSNLNCTVALLLQALTNKDFKQKNHTRYNECI
jgi:hypothetical protein